MSLFNSKIFTCFVFSLLLTFYDYAVSLYPRSVSKPFPFTPHLPLSSSLCHSWPVSSLCRASPGSAQLARWAEAGGSASSTGAERGTPGRQAQCQQQHAIPLAAMFTTHTYAHIYLYIAIAWMHAHTSISGPMPNGFGLTGTELTGTKHLFTH